MSCVSADSLQRFSQGALQGERLAEVERHLDGCADCRALLAQALRDDAAPEPRRPNQVGAYWLEEPIGSGGMGVVYAARDPRLERAVALKLLLADPDHPEAQAALLREARALARLAHPNVLPIYEAGEQDRRVYLAMERAQRSLADWLLQPHSIDSILELFIAAGRGLEAAHQAGLVHRDFKPANVLLGAQGRPMVADFGLARPVQRVSPGDPGKSDSPSQSGSASESGSNDNSAVIGQAKQTSAAGSLAYMSPEQLRGEPLDARADLYSFTAALYQALYGKPPLEAASAAGRLKLLATDSPELSARGRDGSRISRPLRALLARGLRFEPRDRFPSMAALLAALESARYARGRLLVRAALTTTLLLALAAAALLVRKEAQLERLARERAQLDRSIDALHAQLAAEADPARLASLDTQLARLDQDALRDTQGDRQAEVTDPLERELHALLSRFGADAYAIPPEFTAHVRDHIGRLLQRRHLRQEWLRKQAEWDRIAPAFRARGLPEELGFLAWAESGFDPDARSPSGAAGLFQFMPQTARRFGLVVADAQADAGALDERRDVEKSSAAAAAYLAELFTELGSDSFLLAVAAYNRGEDGMRDALATLSREPGAFAAGHRDFWHLYLRKLLPEETREYVFAVLAAIVVGTHPAEYGM